MTWIDDEPAPSFRHELGYLGRRAAARRWRALALALGAALAVVGVAARRPHTVGSTIVFRVTEGELDPGTAPPFNRELRAHVTDVLLSGPRLLEVIGRHGLYPRERALGDERALEAFRRDLQVEVWRNYFLEGRDDSARTARLSIRYATRDPEVAWAVVQDLGRVVVEAEQAARDEATAAAAAEQRATLLDGRIELTRRRDEMVRAQLRWSRKATATDALAVADAGTLVEQMEQEVHQREQRMAALGLRERLEQRQMGLRFEVVDAGRPIVSRLGRGQLLALLGAAAFLFALPLAVVAVALFDRRIYRADDVRRLGLKVLGAVPPPSPSPSGGR